MTHLLTPRANYITARFTCPFGAARIKWATADV